MDALILSISNNNNDYIAPTKYRLFFHCILRHSLDDSGVFCYYLITCCMLLCLMLHLLHQILQYLIK